MEYMHMICIIRYVSLLCYHWISKAPSPMKPLQEYLDFHGKTVLITGAANGIGRAAARRFSEQGAHLLLLDYDGDALSEFVTDLQAAGAQADMFLFDLQEKAAIDSFWQSIAESHVDVLINNAGMYPFKDFMDLDEAYLNKVMQVNLYAVLWMCQHMIRRQLKRGGVIINVGSIEAIMPFKKELIQYSMSKVGVITLTRDLAREYGGQGFRVNALLPGGIISKGTRGVATKALRRLQFGLVTDAYQFVKRIPLGRMGKADEIATMMVVLASDLSSYVNGALIPVDGGFLSA